VGVSFTVILTILCLWQQMSLLPSLSGIFLKLCFANLVMTCVILAGLGLLMADQLQGKCHDLLLIKSKTVGQIVSARSAIVI